MINRDIEKITKEELQALVDNKVIENKVLEYKQTLPGNSDAEKKEFLADVSSFANENGGILLYGVPQTEEEVPVPRDISDCGIEIPEQMTIDIENILLDVVKPILPELTIKVIKINPTNQGSLLMIYHPESWGKPHMVEGYNHGRFYRR